MNICGIYKIENLINHKVYIGSSKDINNRFRLHKYHLINNKHHNLHLQSSYNKYGINKFRFDILEECKENELIKQEQEKLDLFKMFTFVYNTGCCVDNPKRGTHLSKETKQKMSKSLKGRMPCFKGKKHSEESKEKNRKSHLGKTAWNKGSQWSEETKKKMRKPHKTNHIPWNKGKNQPEETKQKISNSLKGCIPWNKGLSYSNLQKGIITNKQSSKTTTNDSPEIGN